MDAAETARALWPRFGHVFPLELVLSATVILAAWAVLAVEAEPLFFKARFTEAWLAATPGKYEVMERIALDALTGSGEINEEGKLSRYVSSRRVAGASVALRGDIPGMRGYEAGFYPALAEGGAVVLWLCGRAQTPPGWTAQAAAPATNLPDRFAPHQCRGRPSR